MKKIKFLINVNDVSRSEQIYSFVKLIKSNFTNEYMFITEYNNSKYAKNKFYDRKYELR